MQPRWKWVVFDFLFISIYQNLLVLLTTLPTVAVLLILLFWGSSTLGEYISKSKYPEYSNYIKTVNRFIPGLPYGGK